MNMHSTYYLRTAGMMGGEMIAVVKCRGEKAGNILLRRTRRSTHKNRGALVNVHDDTHSCCLGKGKSQLTLDHPIECRVFVKLR